jgi:two-component system CheB/CheR fusion protein
MVIAQDPATAKFDGMPASVIDTGFVDFIMSPDQIPEQLIKWLRNNHQKEDIVSSDLQHIFTIIRAKTGYDFSSYKLNTISRRIEKQMHIHRVKTLSDYILLLRRDPEEVTNLFKGLLIGVTRFFRDTEAFDVLKKDIIPKILKKKPLDYCIRVWVPGCSTGEEVYSIAITIAEYMEEIKHHYYVQIFGTDIDSNALAVARTGVYSDVIEHDVSTDRLKRFFTKEKNKYKIKKEIRSMVVFGEQNIIKDPPFTKVDMISCRNLLIYLNVKLQKIILPMFHYSLNPQGVLFLGMSESIAGYADLYELVNRKVKFFERKDSSGSKRAILRSVGAFCNEDVELHSRDKKMLKDESTEVNLALKKLLLDKFVSPCLLINKKGAVLYAHGKINQYIKSFPLQESLTIYEMVDHRLKSVLKSTIQSAITKKQEVLFRDIAVSHEHNAHTINLRVTPLTEFRLLSDLILISFEEALTLDHAEIVRTLKNTTTTKKNKIIADLETELSETKENLQATIEELESSNEELQSVNEELQSTNEEIETSKEELQSLNEELMIMNTELQNRIDQLATVHDDMTNLFNSTEIATFFLDNNLCIKRFTPKAQDFIHLIPTDIGRSIRHFATEIKYEKLTEDAEEVLRTLNQKSVEVQNKSDRWFLLRILPYRTISNMIDGVVITLTDITAHKDAEKKLSELNDALENALVCSKNLLDTVMVPLLVLTTDLKIISANRAFYKNFHFLPEEVIGKLIYTITELSLPELQALLEQNFPDDNAFEGFEIEKVFPKIGMKKISINARKIFNNEYGTNVILLAMDAK